MSSSNCSVQPQNSLKPSPACDHSHFFAMTRTPACVQDKRKTYKKESQTVKWNMRGQGKISVVICCVLVKRLPTCPFMAFCYVMTFKPPSTATHHIIWQPCLFISQITCLSEHMCGYKPFVSLDVNSNCSCTTQHTKPRL